jgi:hypothetical protein
MMLTQRKAAPERSGRMARSGKHHTATRKSRREDDSDGIYSSRDRATNDSDTHDWWTTSLNLATGPRDVADAQVADAQVADAQVADAQVADAQVADSQVAAGGTLIIAVSSRGAFELSTPGAATGSGSLTQVRSRRCGRPCIRPSSAASSYCYIPAGFNRSLRSSASRGSGRHGDTASV